MRGRREVSFNNSRDIPLPLGRCDSPIVAVSQGVAEDLAQTTGLLRERIQVIYNPVMTPELLEKAKEPLVHPWFAAGKPPLILFAGRLTRQKDYPTLIRAFAQIRAQRPARLMILGEGEKRSKLEALIQELGLRDDISLPGFVDNPYAYMARAAVFVLSSAWEGFGNVLAEAMAVGTPVVATDCPSGPAEILEGGKWGRLVPVGDVEALTVAIGDALEQGFPNREGLKQMASIYSLNNIADSYLEVLNIG